jgi:hypothetical protein
MCHCKGDFYIHICILRNMGLKFTDALVNSIGARQCGVNASWEGVQRCEKA